MAITMEDVKAGRVDFSDIDEPGGQPVGPIHPGEILLEDFMKPLGLSARALARALRVPHNRLLAIIDGKRAITADTALRLARYFSGDAGWWLRLQAQFDLEMAERDLAGRIASEVTPRKGLRDAA
jgi:addiction module HigA family antidote